MNREMGGAVPSWLTLSDSQRAEMEKYRMPDGWRVVSQASLPTVLFEGFRNQVDTAVLIAQRTSTGGAWLVFNARRVDARAGAIDQEPFAIIVHSTGANASGMLLHHVNWPGRTSPVPTDFWYEVRTSGIGDYFQAHPPLGKLSGSLAELPPGDRAAFDQVTRYYRKKHRPAQPNRVIFSGEDDEQRSV